ncbi:hypothetical protein Tco_0525945, partial [Tanacetum coccineum]
QGDLMLLSPQHVGFGNPSNPMVHHGSTNLSTLMHEADPSCSRHMSGNIAHLLDFKDFDGGYVTFGGGANGGIMQRQQNRASELKRVSQALKDLAWVRKQCKRRTFFSSKLQKVWILVDLPKVSMIGSLVMYLTISRPDIMVAVCGSAGFQVDFLLCQETTVVATSTTEAEYVAAASCCGQMVFFYSTRVDCEQFGILWDIINRLRYKLTSKGAFSPLMEVLVLTYSSFLCQRRLLGKQFSVVTLPLLYLFSLPQYDSDSLQSIHDQESSEIGSAEVSMLVQGKELLLIQEGGQREMARQDEGMLYDRGKMLIQLREVNEVSKNLEQEKKSIPRKSTWKRDNKLEEDAEEEEAQRILEDNTKRRGSMEVESLFTKFPY